MVVGCVLLLGKVKRKRQKYWVHEKERKNTKAKVKGEK